MRPSGAPRTASRRSPRCGPRASLIARRQAIPQAECRRLQPLILDLVERHFPELANALSVYWSSADGNGYDEHPATVDRVFVSASIDHFSTGFVMLRWGGYAALAAAVVTLGAALLMRGGGRRRSIVIAAGLAVVAVATVAVPWQWRRTARAVPRIHDITTDMQNPPEFVALIGDVRPDLVITHSANDLHWDHGLVNRATVSALRRTPCDLLAYLSSPEMNAQSPYTVEL